MQSVRADIGSDDNLMDLTMLTDIREEGFVLREETSSNPILLEMAANTERGSSAHIKNDHIITQYMEVHNRHESSLILRDIQWHFTEESIPEPFTGRPVLEALAISNPDILASAADRLNGGVYWSNPVDSGQQGGRIAPVYECVYH